ncbi:hypothetical protein OKW21_000212 [Catalinimonas alkaloidigena]|uniref:vanadium-dependent haloperoxidase n=1 Tax=Catalinimonas alkaloidigena TaxID=1075417 RepID=UPI0024051812|nr:vanadium-dependent haloperoxidase [Catalinimonas alkaloidigena]MDF9794949.1 hypothetical protein [Catalinimonas alkaloidigena]
MQANYFAILLVFFLACDPSEEPSASQKKVEENNSFIIDLNALTYTIANEHDNFYSFIGVRALTMVHLAIHDALNVVQSRYETYAFHEKHPDADPLTAATEAVRNILLELYPQRSDTIKLVCDEWVSSVAASEEKARSISLGKKIADTYIRLREGDGHEKQGDYTPMTKPGDYQYTPGWNEWVLKPDFDYARPFALDTVTQFRSPPPPALTSEAYTQSYNEVKAYGMKNSTLRSEDQTHYAHWWAEFAEHGWNRIGRIVAKAEGLAIHETARMFALINMDIYDIYLASLESKYYYDTWRPLTAIQEAETDGNPNTEADPDWEPEMLTPPWPEYPSAHASVAAGGAEIVSEVLGSPEVSFTMESVSALPEGKTRTYTNLRQAADDCADSRIMNGYHFRFATEEGKRQGKAVAQHIIANYLRPVSE